MVLFSRKLRERVLLKNSCSIDHQHDKTIADHQPLTTANDKTIADHQPLTTANDKNDKTIADHQPLTTANDKTMRRSAEKICWEDLLRKSAEKICWEDLLRRSAEENLLRRSAEKICWEDLLIRQWEDLLRRSAEKICWENLLRRSAEKICWEDLLRRSAEKICWRKSAEKICWEDLLKNLLRRSAEKICWEDLLRRSAEKICWRKSAEKICWEDLLRMVVDQAFFKISFFFYAGWVWSIKTGDHPLVTSCSSDVQNWGEMRILKLAVATLSSLRAHRTSKTEVKCECWSSPSQPSRRFVLIGRPKLRWNANFEARRRNPLVVSCSSDVQNWGEMRIGLGRLATLSSFRAHRTSKTEVKCEFWSSPSQPSRHFVLIGRPKLRWNANVEARRRNPLVVSCSSDVQNWGEMRILKLAVATLSSFRAHRTSKTEVKCESAWVVWQPSRRFVLIGRPKLWWNANLWLRRWTLSSLRAGQMSETVVKWWFLYAACCPGLPALDSYIFAYAAVVKRGFWNVEWHAVVARRTFCFCWMNPLVGFGGSMARNCGETQIFYGNCRGHRAKRSFWKLCCRKFEGSLARNVRFGSLFCEISRKPHTKRSFWKLCSMKFGGGLAWNARFGSLFC